jgi:hypothetical protein
MEDIRQTREWKKYLESCGWVVEKVNVSPQKDKVVNVFIKRVPLTPFSMMKIQRFCGKLDFKDLNSIRKEYRVVYTVVEPATAGRPSNEKSLVGGLESSWKVNTRPFLPTKTIVVDLKKSEKELWNDLSTNAKRILKQEDSTSEQIIFRKNDSSDEKSRIAFYEAWKEAGKTWVMGEARFNKLLKAFGKKTSLWVSEKNGKSLSGIVLLESGDMANYFQTWTSEEGREKGAHYHLVWRVMLECKRKGLRWFDFEGILDERWPQKKWSGFSEFKKKFGGKVVSCPGSYTKWF